MTNNHFTPSSIRACPVCQRQVSGPSNQVYCGRKCQQGHNNSLARALRHRIKEVSNILITNARILIDVLGARERTIVDREILLGKGYNFAFHTHRVTAGERTYLVVFDVGLTEIKRHKYLIRIFKNDGQLENR